MREAIQQALGYARRLSCPVAFASDGNVVAAAHAIDGNALIINDSPVSAFLPERHLLHFEQTRIWDRGERFAASGDLVKLFNSARKFLNREGIAKVEAFNEFAKLLFVKILTELHDDGGEMFQEIPAKWGDIANLAGENLMREYARVLDALNEKYEGGFGATRIKTSAVLESLIGLIKPRSFIDTDADVKGAAYEYFLRDYTKSKDELNRYFTPRHIVKAMVKLINPQNGEKVYDPFCGTGGMLIEAYKHMHRQLPAGGEDRKKMLRRLRQNSLFGRDISDAAHVAKMNMILTGDGHSNIEKGDSLSAESKHYDVVLTNIPFATDGEARFIRHCLDAVKNNERGRAAIIVPERIACESQYSHLRESILEEWRVDRLISLPRDVFAEYTNAKTSILFVSWRGRGDKQKTADVFKIERDGFEGKSHRQPAINAPNDIEDMLMDAVSPRRVALAPPNFFFNRSGAAAIRPRRKADKLVKVGDVIRHIERIRDISPGMVCIEPGFQAKEHRIFAKQRKPHSQVKVRRRYAIRRGDLVIGLLHTQNGLIAFSDSDEEFHATKTHAAFKIDESQADKRYLFWTLRGILMTMKRVDTVGRENFKVGEILALPLPLPPMAKQRAIGEAMDNARRKIRDAEAALQKARADFNETEKRLQTFDID